MKKSFAILLALMMVFAITACGGKDDPKPSGSDTPSSSRTRDEQSKPEESQPPATEAPSERGGWSKAEYAEYTNGVPEPAFPYTITGVIGNMGLSFKSGASAGEFATWRQSLLDNGFEENSVAGDTWTVFNDTHSIAHSGSGYFNIQTK